MPLPNRQTRLTGKSNARPLAYRPKFLDCAPVMMSLDLVISSDTAVADLTGALGCPLWLC